MEVSQFGCRRLARATILLTAIIAGILPHLASASCGSAFCSLSTDWNLQGVWTDPGVRVDVRYEYINQDQTTVGNRTVSVGALPRDHSEVRTVNQNVIATIDYTFSESWSMSLGIPYVDRQHTHIETATGLKEKWSFGELGDVRVLGRYQPENHDLTSNSSIGLNFGLKLPTGRTDVTNSAGEKAERTLQPGTGTTDLLFGAFFRKRMGTSSTVFLQGLWQNALDTKDAFQPGAKVFLDAGYRNNVTGNLALLLQLNTLIKGVDSGAHAEPQDSGGTFVYLSPGASYALGNSFQVYGFYQLPVYQFVNGLQLTSTDSYAIGASARF